MTRFASIATLLSLILLIGLSIPILSGCRGGSGKETGGGSGGGGSKSGLTEQELADAKKGRALFKLLGCDTCHMNPTTGKNYPDLRGIYGKKVRFKDGSVAVVDDAYLRESILQSNKRILAGYEPAMPDFSHLKEEQVRQLIAYIKSLKDEKPEFVKPESFAE
ncbi:MAG: cytochrome c [Armatimonadota bacterium]